MRPKIFAVNAQLSNCRCHADRSKLDRPNMRTEHTIFFFSANPSHCSLSFSSSGLTTWFPRLLLLLLRIFVVFLFYTFSCCFRAVDYATHVGFRAHVKIASRIVFLFLQRTGTEPSLRVRYRTTQRKSDYRIGDYFSPVVLLSSYK